MKLPAWLLPVAAAATAAPLERVKVSPDGGHFVFAGSGKRFVPWGFNYDRDASGRLIEDYWDAEWQTVTEDFGEMKSLGANLVRIHLQTGAFMTSPVTTDGAALRRLAMLLDLAEATGLYLDLTGLGCYHRAAVPEWYAALPERERWAVQARFWEAVARVGGGRAAVFCYDLMNEPLAPDRARKETDWLAGELAGKYYIQRISLDAAGREPAAIAAEWIRLLSGAIRAADPSTMITVGEIPWALEFPGARPVCHSREAGGPLDFTSVHFYPSGGQVPRALEALAVYEIGKPLLVEEMFPLRCDAAELERFIDASGADGWLGFYWGKLPEEYSGPEPGSAVTRGWLELFRRKASTMNVGR